jgi:recombination protein RecR
MNQSEPIERLISEFSKLPGIGRKSAQRLAYHLMTSDAQISLNLSDAIKTARESVKLCSVCFNLSDQDPCKICSNPKRDQTTICVVSDSKDILAIEKTNEYFGLYHVLGGSISPIHGIGPKDLTLDSLVSRLNPSINEVILATNLSVEGETTAMYIAKVIAPLQIPTTRIARGIPAGAELEYTDEATLAGALLGRKPI